MPHVVATWKSDPAGWQKLLNSQRVHEDVKDVGREMIEVAKGVFLSASEGDSEAPVYYVNSFRIKDIRNRYKLRGVRVLNYDPTAEWVEFGAHAGGKTPVLKYRVFGISMDIMNSKVRAT